MKELIEKLEGIINIFEDDGDYQDCVVTIQQAIATLQERQWISVAQATPYDGMYLCLVEQTQQCGTIWKVQKVMQNLFNNWVVNHNEKITHWMPLPTPPNK